MILALRVAVATSLATPIAVTAQPARVADTRAVEAVLSQYKGDCQEFRVWAGIMGKKETLYASTQGAGDSG